MTAPKRGELAARRRPPRREEVVAQRRAAQADLRERARAQLQAQLESCVALLGIVPTPTQAKFLLDNREEVLYGGAAGGGKSIALLIAAVMYVDVPGYGAIIFRPMLTELEGPNGLMSVARNLIGSRARFDNTTHRFTFRSGATLSFGHLDTANDKYRQYGYEYQFIGFDELTHFDEDSYLHLRTRLRRRGGSDALASVPLRIRATANPGGAGHEWVKARFIDPASDAALAARYPNRAFHPARIVDNPYLDQAAYEATMNEVPPVLRAQMLHGDWNIAPDGRLFQRDWFPRVTRAEIPDDLDRLRYWDLAATAPTPGTDPDYTVGVLVGRDRDGIFYVLDVRRARVSVPRVRQLLRATAERDGYDVTIGIEEEPGSSGKLLLGDLRTGPLEGYTVRGDRPTGSKITRAEFLAARAGDGYLKIRTADWNDTLLDELVLFPDGRHDDQVDALTGAIRLLAQRPQHEIDPKYFGDINDSLSREPFWSDSR